MQGGGTGRNVGRTLVLIEINNGERPIPISPTLNAYMCFESRRRSRRSTPLPHTVALAQHFRSQRTRTRKHGKTSWCENCPGTNWVELLLKLGATTVSRTRKRCGWKRTMGDQGFSLKPTTSFVPTSLRCNATLRRSAVAWRMRGRQRSHSAQTVQLAATPRSLTPDTPN